MNGFTSFYSCVVFIPLFIGFTFILLSAGFTWKEMLFLLKLDGTKRAFFYFLLILGFANEFYMLREGGGVTGGTDEAVIESVVELTMGVTVELIVGVTVEIIVGITVGLDTFEMIACEFLS